MDRDSDLTVDVTQRLGNQFFPIDLISLAMQPGLGPRTLSSLLTRFGNAKSVVTAPTEELLSISGVGNEIVSRIRQASNTDQADATVNWCHAQQASILSWGSETYPVALQQLSDAPPILYMQGNLIPTDQLAVAVVGTRHATTYGLKQANRFSYALAKAGITIVSGLARGIDAAAHRGALDAGGRTIAVLGSGLAKLYPREHQTLAAEISKQGAVLSEYAPQCPPRSGQFPQRNRLIAGLTLGTLVIEAPDRSGALITARLAGEQNRDVFALPGPVNSRASRGCNQLIRDGATLVQSVDEIIEELGPFSESIVVESGRVIRNGAELNLNEVECRVLDAIEPTGTSIDQVIAATPFTPQQVVAVISVLEIRRLIRRLSGQYVSRI
ncbi:MAG: DNA-processing protein DprA [Rubripirellula sp.]|nr:DNA-processing protein DprA [Rubripirellula sp.]